MKSVIVCPECKNLVYFNSYFGAYICENCGWEDASYAKKRDSCVAESQELATIKIRHACRGAVSGKTCSLIAQKGQITRKKKAVLG